MSHITNGSEITSQRIRRGGGLWRPGRGDRGSANGRVEEVDISVLVKVVTDFPVGSLEGDLLLPLSEEAFGELFVGVAVCEGESSGSGNSRG